MAFARRRWSAEGMAHQLDRGGGKRRKELCLPEVYLYEKDTRAVILLSKDYVNKELTPVQQHGQATQPKPGGRPQAGSEKGPSHLSRKLDQQEGN